MILAPKENCLGEDVFHIHVFTFTLEYFDGNFIVKMNFIFDLFNNITSSFL